MAQHLHYWSCTKFADWIRGTPKPCAETSDGWNRWEKLAKSTHPYRYWIADTGLSFLQDFVTWPIRKLYDIKYYINNRWVTKTHALTAHPRDIHRGEWRDVGNRFLPCLFNELVDFVELETAWNHIAWGSEEERKKYNTPFWAFGWFRWRTWRCPQAGIDHLNWAASLKHDDEWVDKDSPEYGKPTHQAYAAMEILALYDWWIKDYRNRKDPMDLGGWSEYCEKRRSSSNDDGIMSMFSDENRTEEDREESSKAMDLTSKIEKEQDDEDTEMMIRLIKIRQSLWT